MLTDPRIATRRHCHLAVSSGSVASSPRKGSLRAPTTRPTAGILMGRAHPYTDTISRILECITARERIVDWSTYHEHHLPYVFAITCPRPFVQYMQFTLDCGCYGAFLRNIYYLFLFAWRYAHLLRVCVSMRVYLNYIARENRCLYYGYNKQETRETIFTNIHPHILAIWDGVASIKWCDFVALPREARRKFMMLINHCARETSCSQQPP